jgi:hypothetical protein
MQRNEFEFAFCVNSKFQLTSDCHAKALQSSYVVNKTCSTHIQEKMRLNLSSRFFDLLKTARFWQRTVVIHVTKSHILPVV